MSNRMVHFDASRPQGSAPVRKRTAWQLVLDERLPAETLREWLYRTIRDAIVSKRLEGGQRLPATRDLAQHYAIARGTVSTAYEQLKAEGYLAATAGSGTRVSSQLPERWMAGVKRRGSASHVVPTSPVAQHAAPPTGNAAEAGSELLRLVTRRGSPFPILGRQGPPVPFAPHACDTSPFPLDIWRRLGARQARASRMGLFRDAPAQGLMALRQAIAEHLRLSRGADVSVDRIVVVGSVQQGFDLTLRLLTMPNDEVWVEDPGYPPSRLLIEANGRKAVNVLVDDCGMSVEDGVRLAARARLAYVTASRHAPLGVPLALPRRLALLEWAESSGAYILEDDYDSEYRYRGRPIPALLGLDRSQRVILAGTFSKLLFPGLRLAYLVVPDRLVSPFTRALSITSRFENGLTQATLAEFMTEGHFDRHVRRMRQIYAARAQAFEAAARSCWKGFIEVASIQAGLDVTARLAVDRSDAVVARRLAQVGVEVQPLSAYSSSRHVPPGLVMGFAAFNETQILRTARDVAKGLGI